MADEKVFKPIPSPSHEALCEQYGNKRIDTSYITVPGRPDDEKYGVDLVLPVIPARDR